MNTLRFTAALLIVCLCLIFTKQCPSLSFPEGRLLLCAAVSFILWNFFVYSRFVKYVPLGVVGAMVIGCNAVWSALLTLIFDR